MVFAEPDSPVYLQGGFDLAVTMMENQALLEPAFRSGKGVGWGEQSQCLFCAAGRFFRPGYHNSLAESWLPALDGVVAKLERGATVADVGCGHGFSRSEEHTSELQSLMRISYAVFCLKKKKPRN